MGSLGAALWGAIRRAAKWMTRAPVYTWPQGGVAFNRKRAHPVGHIDRAISVTEMVRSSALCILNRERRGAAPNGWRLTGPDVIELGGDACTQLLLGADNLVSAEFPCDVFSPNGCDQHLDVYDPRTCP
jgi:hypothetical protein